MRIYLFLFSFVILAGIMTVNTVVNAQTSTPETNTGIRPTSLPANNPPRGDEPRNGTSTNRLEERLASSTERREERQELRQERQVALNAIRQQRVLNLSANISNRMEAAISRLYNIVERTESRIITLKNQGVDTAASEEKLREATAYLSEAKAAILNIDTLVNEATTSNEPQNRWVEVRATYSNIAGYIRSAHQALRESLALLKTAVTEAELTTSEAVRQNTASSTDTNQ
jgi:hypothetical protein